MKYLLIVALLVVGCTTTKTREYLCIGGNGLLNKKGWSVKYMGISCEIKCEVRK